MALVFIVDAFHDAVQVVAPVTGSVLLVTLKPVGASVKNTGTLSVAYSVPQPLVVALTTIVAVPGYP
jgi:hypothetical protein